MTCGINLGILLICFLHTLHICRSWASPEGKGSWTHNTNQPVDLWSVQGRSKGSRPQDEFRQAYVVKGSSIDTGTKQGPYNKESTASLARNSPYIQYYPSSLAKSTWHNVDSSNGNVAPKQAFGQSLSMAGKHVRDSSNNGNHRTLSSQQGTQRTGQYAPSKHGLHRPKVSSHQSSAWKPTTGKVQQKPSLDTNSQLTDFSTNHGFNPPKEFIKATSGLSRGRKVYLKDKKYSSSLSYNPIVSNIHKRYELPISQHFGLHQSPESAYGQNPQLVSLQTGVGPAGPMTGQEQQREEPGPGQQFANTIVHHIPRPHGGHPIKRLGDEEPVEQTTTRAMPKKPVTRKPTKIYTFPPRQTESYKPRPPVVHKKSKWIRIRSHQLTGFPGSLLRTL